ncbi:MAG: hypothetical protein JO306_13710 [Gemmatimonadetes bacterium]|nr:hypothetical protein [Gemmatimonadota bacterium]
MRIAQEALDYAAKSAEFRVRGSEVYLPVVDVTADVGADREEVVAAD